MNTHGEGKIGLIIINLEQQAIRESVGMYEMSSYAKIRVKGSEDAMDFLQLICANDVDVKPGKMVYTQWLNDKGGIEADVTVTRLALDDYLDCERNGLPQ